MNVALGVAEKRIVLAAFDAVEREAGRAQLSPRVQSIVKRAREVISAQCRKQRQHWRETGEYQLALNLPVPRPSGISRKKRNGRHRYAMYPFAMVEDARKMRANGHAYSAIAQALNTEYGTAVSWRTIADWTCGVYRIMA